MATASVAIIRTGSRHRRRPTNFLREHDMRMFTSASCHSMSSASREDGCGDVDDDNDTDDATTIIHTTEDEEEEDVARPWKRAEVPRTPLRSSGGSTASTLPWVHGEEDVLVRQLTWDERLMSASSEDASGTQNAPPASQHPTTIALTKSTISLPRVRMPERDVVLEPMPPIRWTERRARIVRLGANNDDDDGSSNLDTDRYARAPLTAPSLSSSSPPVDWQVTQRLTDGGIIVSSSKSARSRFQRGEHHHRRHDRASSSPKRRHRDEKKKTRTTREKKDKKHKKKKTTTTTTTTTSTTRTSRTPVSLPSSHSRRKTRSAKRNDSTPAPQHERGKSLPVTVCATTASSDSSSSSAPAYEMRPLCPMCVPTSNSPLRGSHTHRFGYWVEQGTWVWYCSAMQRGTSPSFCGHMWANYDGQTLRGAKCACGAPFAVLELERRGGTFGYWCRACRVFPAQVRAAGVSQRAHNDAR